MKIKTRRTIVIGLLALAAGSGAVWAALSGRRSSEALLLTQARQGEFQVIVSITGELRASKYVEIQIPPNAQAANQYQMKISSLVPEGTVVKAGEIVAELDRSAIAARASEVSLALQKAEAQLTQAMLDSTLTLSKAREDIRNLTYAVEEKRIARDQATYEAPSIRRQAEIDMEKSERALAQAKVNFVTNQRQAEARLREVSTEVERQRNLHTLVHQVMEGFVIRAPESGMVIYDKEWNGKKKTAGSQVSPWDPTVATLPDLSRMESVTFVNEIDVRKITPGQEALIALDSDPSKRLTGTVTTVANVGEQRPNTAAKVFEVKITIAESDTTLRPGMTTANSIITRTLPSALSIPLEAVFNEDDTPYVYKKSGRRILRQEIETGLMNENEIVVVRGLEPADEVLLSPPAKPEDVVTRRLPGSPADPADATTAPAGGAQEGQPSSPEGGSESANAAGASKRP